MKALICDKCGAPMKRGASECEYCGTQYETRNALTEEEQYEINERMRRSEDVTLVRTEEDKRRLLMDAAYLSPEVSGTGIAYFHGKRVIWEE